MGFESHEYTREVSGFVEHGAGGDFETDTEFVGDDIAQCGLAKPRRAVKQGVVKGLAAQTGGLDEYAEILDGLLLTCEVVKLQRSQCLLYVAVALSAGRLLL